MALSNDLISQFVQVTKEDKKSVNDTAYGTIVEYDGGKYVKLDGSELLTPISMTADALEGERVVVTIKNHNAIVTGNISSPAARTDSVKELGTKISEFEIIIADKVSVERLEAEIARIDTLVSENVTIKGKLEANEADIRTLEADNVTINEKLTAAEANIGDLEAKKIDATVVEATYATIANLEAEQAKINNLEATYGEFHDLTVERLDAAEANIDNLETTKLSAKDAEIKYANIDFANIDMAAVQKLFTDSGIIKDLIVSEGKITGELVGVTIKGDLIEAGTLRADKLVVKGSDGNYYKLNTDFSKMAGVEPVKEDQIHGSSIVANSITATKISVDDLVAFGATIGGFNITKSSIYSGVKASPTNTTRGMYLDKDGQMAIGDGSNFLRYYKDQNGDYKLELHAQEIKFGASGKSVEAMASEMIVSNVEEFYQSTSPTSLSGGSWSTTQPTWTDGTYIWRRNAVTYGDGSSEYTPSANGVCITGNTGSKGDKGDKGDTGETGPQGISVTNTTRYYILRSSDSETPSKPTTNPPGEDWTTTEPTYVSGSTDFLYFVDCTEFSNGEFSYSEVSKSSTYEMAKAEFESIRTVVNDQSTEIRESKEQILLTASQVTEKVSANEFYEYQEKAKADFSVMSSNIEMNFETSKNSIETVNGEMQSKFEEWSKYIRFSENGITIGESGNQLTLRIDNNLIVFAKNGEPIGTWDGDNFYTGNMVVRLNERAQFGNFAFVPRSDGSLMFLKVGG